MEVKAASKLRPFARLQMGGVRIDTPSGDRLAAVDNLIVEIGEVVANVPSRLRIEALGMVVSADAVGGTRRRAMLKALGYAELELDLILDSMIDLHADTWTMDPLIVKIAGVGDLRIEGHFSGVSIGGFAVDSRRKAAQESAKIDRFTLRFDNAGLVERAIDRQASMTGVPREEFVERFVGAIPFMLQLHRQPALSGQARRGGGGFPAPAAITDHRIVARLPCFARRDRQGGHDQPLGAARPVGRRNIGQRLMPVPPVTPRGRPCLN